MQSLISDPSHPEILSAASFDGRLLGLPWLLAMIFSILTVGALGQRPLPWVLLTNVMGIDPRLFVLIWLLKD